MLRSRLLGIPLVVHERFDVGRFATTEATLTSLVPTQLLGLLDAGVDLSRFRVILLGGAAAPADLLARARDAGAPIVTTYGMSETAGGCVYDGLPLDGVELRIEPDGRVAIRGPMLMSGYRCRSDLTAAAVSDGWLLTADLAERDDAGRVRVTGRYDDVIITGGENVDPAVVAAVLARHPAVREVVVVGVPDERWGERVVAVVVAAEALPTLGELRRWCRELPVAARPRGVVSVARMPTLALGKPDRLALRRLAETGG
jgi:O-succinylbenzoic acid--CoA ligase